MKALRGVLAIAVGASLCVPVAAEAAVKAGSSCTKVGAQRSAKPQPLVCTKVGGRLVWVRKPSKTTTVLDAAATTQPTPSATATPTPTGPRDQIALSTHPVFRVVNGALERWAEGGYFASDSRSADAFTEVRRKANAEIGARVADPGHSNVNFDFRISESFPKDLAEYSKAELIKAASLWSPIFRSRIDVKVIFATEKDIPWIKNEPYMFTDTVATLERLGALTPGRDRTWITGGGHYWNQGGTPRATVFLGAASFADVNLMNDQWPQTPAHEFAHIVQDYLRYPRQPGMDETAYLRTFPLNLIEGSARTLGFHSLPNLGWASDGIDYNGRLAFQRTRLWTQIDGPDDIVRLLNITEARSSEQVFDFSYTLGALFYEWFIATYGLRTFLDLIRETPKHADFADSVYAVMRVTKDQLYRDASPYIFSEYQRITK